MLKPTNTHKLWELALRDKNMMPAFGYGAAGTGKTYGAVSAAVEWLQDGKKNNVLLTRPNVVYADDPGYLPGTEEEKAAPWMRPFEQNFLLHGIGKAHLDDLKAKKRVQFQTLAFVQGLTFDNTFIIVDECQNLTFDQIKMLMTRVGNWTKIAFCGDTNQVSPKFKNSVLAEWLRMTKELDLPYHTIEFTHDDILRGDVCKQTIIACDKWEEMKCKR